MNHGLQAAGGYEPLRGDDPTWADSIFPTGQMLGIAPDRMLASGVERCQSAFPQAVSGPQARWEAASWRQSVSSPTGSRGCLPSERGAPSAHAFPLRSSHRSEGGGSADRLLVADGAAPHGRRGDRPRPREAAGPGRDHGARTRSDERSSPARRRLSSGPSTPTTARERSCSFWRSAGGAW